MKTTIYCPTKILKPIVVDIAQAMRRVKPGDFLEVVSDQAFMVREAHAFARMSGCEVVREADREVKMINLSRGACQQFKWNNSQPATNHEWLIWLKKHNER